MKRVVNLQHNVVGEKSDITVWQLTGGDGQLNHGVSDVNNCLLLDIAATYTVTLVSYKVPGCSDHMVVQWAVQNTAVIEDLLKIL